jgi:hypothetical protein
MVASTFPPPFHRAEPLVLSRTLARLGQGRSVVRKIKERKRKEEGAKKR